MLFFRLFYIFLLIGAFTFGGGYSMVAMIEDEVVTKQGWMTLEGFTDLLAISQMTPGPIGINTATFAGYQAAVASGLGVWGAVVAALVASVAVVLIPVVLMVLVSGGMERWRRHPRVAKVLAAVRLAVVGLIAAAALSLMTADNFGVPALTQRFVVSVTIFAAVFVLNWRYKVSPIVLLLAAGAVGLIVGA